jgi:cystathionine beta-synthase
VSDDRLVSEWDCLSRPPTPIVSLELPELRLLAKLEYLQPGGSVKARVGRSMLEELIATGRLTSDTRYVVEASSGNAAVALAIAVRELGLAAKVVAVATDKVSRPKVERMRRYGVDVRLVPFEVVEGASQYDTPHMVALRKIAAELPGSVVVGQFENPGNPRAHEQTTGREIIEQLPEPPDALVIGAGSGGSLTGIGRALRRAGWPCRIVLVDPIGSVIGPTWLGVPAPPGRSFVEGIGHDFVPQNLDMSLIEDAVLVPDDDTLATARQLVRCGFSVGSSSACAVAGARRWAGRQRHRPVCLVLFSDHGSRYPKFDI